MKTTAILVLAALSAGLVACSKSPADQNANAAEPKEQNKPAEAQPTQAYTDARLHECINEIYKEGQEEAFRELKAFLNYTEEAKTFKKEKIAKHLAVLALAASRAPASSTFSISDIMPLDKKPQVSAIINDTFLQEMKKGTSASGKFSAGRMSGEYIGLLPDVSGLVGKSLFVARGEYYSKRETAQTQNIQAYVTILSVTATANGGLGITNEEDPMNHLSSRKHYFRSILPDECLILNNEQELQFPLGAGSRYRFAGASAECFGGLVFIGSDEDIPLTALTFMLLPDRGLTYIHGRGSVYRKGAKLFSVVAPVAAPAPKPQFLGVFSNKADESHKKSLMLDINGRGFYFGTPTGPALWKHNPATNQIALTVSLGEKTNRTTETFSVQFDPAKKEFTILDAKHADGSGPLQHDSDEIPQQALDVIRHWDWHD